MSNKNRTILYGTISSLIVNWLFIGNDISRPIGTLQYNVCIYIPILVGIPMALISIFLKSVLRDKISSNKWDIVQAEELLLREKNMIKRMLARIYIILDKPLLILGGWVVGSGLFYYLAQTLT